MAQKGIGLRSDVTLNRRSLEAVASEVTSRMRSAVTIDGRQIQGISRPLGKITGQADDFTKSLAASNARVIAFGASVAIINGVTQAFKGLLEQTVKVEKAFADINVVLGANERDLRKFGDGIFEVAKRTAQSFDTVAEGALEFARQGLGMEESLVRINDALILTRLTGLDVTESVEGLTAAVNTFKKEGITTSQVINKLADLDIKFAVSSEDLIKGLERAGGSAGQARVSFEELAAMIAVVQERTARGGSVIGNALRTIFARLQGEDVINSLEAINIQVRDLDTNKLLSSTKILEQLSKAFNDPNQSEGLLQALGVGLDDIQKADIVQRVAGKRQRETLIALFAEMEGGAGRWADALAAVGNEAQTAYEKNAKLNETLDAILKSTGTSISQLASRMGEVGFSDNLKDLIGGFQGIVENINKLFDPEAGSNLAKGFLKGFGAAITSAPVVGLFLAIIAKLSYDMAKFGIVGLKSLLGLNQAAKQQAVLQDSILHTLMREPAVLDAITQKGMTRRKQEQLLLQILKQQTREYLNLEKLAARITPGIFRGGARATGGGIRTGAGGYLPDAVQKESGNISRGVGGAKSGDRPVVIPNFNYGGGERGPIVAHTGEMIVPNYSGGGSAIFNRDMMSSMGVPRGAKPIAAEGYIPNFARFIPAGSGYRIGGKLYSKQQIPSRIESGEISAEDAARAGYVPSATASAAKIKKAGPKGLGLFLNARGSIGALSALQDGGTKQTSTGYEKLSRSEKDYLTKAGYSKQDVPRITLQGIQARSLENLSKGAVNQTQLRQDAARHFAGPLVKFSQNILGDIFGGSNIGSEVQDKVQKMVGSGGVPDLFSKSVEGGLVESAMKIGVNGAKAVKRFKGDASQNRPFDFVTTVNAAFKKAFKFGPELKVADAKRSATGDAIRTLIGKTLRADGMRNGLVEVVGGKKTAADGFIPNFARSFRPKTLSAFSKVTKADVNPNTTKKLAQFEKGLDYENTITSTLGLPPPNNQFLDIPRGVLTPIVRNKAKKVGWNLPSSMTEGEIKSGRSLSSVASVISKLIASYPSVANLFSMAADTRGAIDLTRAVPNGFGVVNPSLAGKMPITTEEGKIISVSGLNSGKSSGVLHNETISRLSPFFLKKKVGGQNKAKKKNRNRKIIANLNHIRIPLQAQAAFAEGLIPNFAGSYSAIRKAFPNKNVLSGYANKAREGDPRFKSVFAKLGVTNLRGTGSSVVDYSRLDDRNLLKAIDREALRGNPRANKYWQMVNNIFGQNPTWGTSQVVQQLRRQAGGNISFAGGYIPNYADPLVDAVQREASAGVPINQIRVNRDPRLMNAGNPSGLAITNTRDEPTGRIPNFAKKKPFISGGDSLFPEKGQEVKPGYPIGEDTQFTKGGGRGTDIRAASLLEGLGGKLLLASFAFEALAGSAQGTDEDLKGFAGVINDVKGPASEFISSLVNTSLLLTLAGPTLKKLSGSGFPQIGRGITDKFKNIRGGVKAAGGVGKYGKQLVGAASLGPVGIGVAAAGAVFLAGIKAWQTKLDKDIERLRKSGEKIGEARKGVTDKLGELRKEDSDKVNKLLDRLEKSAGSIKEAGLVELAGELGLDLKDPILEADEYRAQLLALRAELRGTAKTAEETRKEFAKMIQKDVLELQIKAEKELYKARVASLTPLEQILKIREKSIMLDNVQQSNIKTQIGLIGLQKEAASDLYDIVSTQIDVDKLSSLKLIPVERVEQYKKAIEDVNRTLSQTSMTEQEIRGYLADKLSLIENADGARSAIIDKLVGEYQKNKELLSIKQGQLLVDQKISLLQESNGRIEDIALSRAKRRLDVIRETRDAELELSKFKGITSKQLGIEKLQLQIEFERNPDVRKDLELLLSKKQFEIEIAVNKNQLEDSLRGLIDKFGELDIAKKIENEDEKLAVNLKSVLESTLNSAEAVFRNAFTIDLPNGSVAAANSFVSTVKAGLPELLNAGGSTPIKLKTEEKEEPKKSPARFDKNAYIKSNTFGFNAEKERPSIQTPISIVLSSEEKNQVKNQIQEELKKLEILKDNRTNPKKQFPYAYGQSPAEKFSSQFTGDIFGGKKKISTFLEDQGGVLGSPPGLLSESEQVDRTAKGLQEIQEYTRGLLSSMGVVNDAMKQSKELAESIGDQFGLDEEQVKNAQKLLFIYLDQKRIQEEITGLKIKQYIEDKRRNELTPRARGFEDAKRELLSETDDQFYQRIAKDTPIEFANGMSKALSEAATGAKSLKSALLDAAQSFLSTLQQAFMQRAVSQIMGSFLPGQMAEGGMVRGGSGVRDDVPTLLMGGEYVIKKSAVKKYGPDFLNQLNSGSSPMMAAGGEFMPVGYYGQGAISGRKDLETFANQRVTSGSRDIITGGNNTASALLEPQSRRLTSFGMSRGSPLQQELWDQQMAAQGILDDQAKYRYDKKKAESKALKQLIVQTILTAAMGYATGAMGSKGGESMFAKMGSQGSKFGQQTSGFFNQDFGFGAGSGNSAFSSQLQKMPVFGFQPPRASGGSVRRGNAMLMGGEYIVGKPAVKTYGKDFFESINNMSMPRFAMGGSAGAAPTEQAAVGKGGDVSISISVQSNGSESTQNDGDRNGQDSRMAEKIKKEVVRIIEEEKRVSGALSSRKRGL